MHKNHPNSIVIVCEQFSALNDPNLTASCLQMPNLKKLAERGTHFSNAYCGAPVCGPSRMSMLSGLSPCHNTVYDNGSTLPSHIPTYAHMLTASGFETALCGRMHIHGLDYHKGFERRLATEILNPIVTQRPDWPADGGPIPSLEDGPTAFPDFSDKPIYKHDEHVTRQALDFLRNRTDTERPFHLTIGYLAAHSGGRPNPAYSKWFKYYLNHPDLPVITRSEDDYASLPENTKRLLALTRRTRKGFRGEYSRREIAIYFSALSFIDEQLGLILKELKMANLDEQTIICFTADHGENLGRHGLVGKMNFYEEAVRVPLYFAGPGIQQGKTIDTPVSLNDLCPTLAHLAGSTIEIPTDGISLLPMLKDGTSLPLDRPVFSEYHGYLCPCGGYMIRRGDWKLVHFPTQEDELYNLTNDPQELCNLATHPNCRDTYQSMRAELDAYFLPAELEANIHQYNLQRDAVATGTFSSPNTCERIIHDIEHFRDDWNEPWWDGGEYMQQFESDLYQHRDK